MVNDIANHPIPDVFLNGDISQLVGQLNSIIRQINAQLLAATGSDVTGPGSSTDNAIARWNGAGGDSLQNSAITIADSSTLVGMQSLTVSGTPDVDVLVTKNTSASNNFFIAAGTAASDGSKSVGVGVIGLGLNPFADDVEGVILAFSADNPSDKHYTLGVVSGGAGVLYPLVLDATGEDSGKQLVLNTNGTFGLNQNFKVETSSDTGVDAVAFTSMNSGNVSVFGVSAKDSDGTDTVGFTVLAKGTGLLDANHELLGILYDSSGAYQINSIAAGTGVLRPIGINATNNDDPQIVFNIDGTATVNANTLVSTGFLLGFADASQDALMGNNQGNLLSIGSESGQDYFFYIATQDSDGTDSCGHVILGKSVGPDIHSIQYVWDAGSGQYQLRGSISGAETSKDLNIFSAGNPNQLLLKADGRVSLGYGQRNATRVVTAAGAVTLIITDYVVVVNKASGAATIANLPSSPAVGDTYIIKDGKGDAATNNITITPAAGTIDGSATYVMNVNYQSAMLIYNGAQWNLI